MGETEELGRGPLSSIAIAVAERRIGRRRGDRLVAASEAMQAAVDRAAAAARSNVPILFTGPSGSGRGALARAAHAWSDRRGGPFVERSCGALPEALQARELFGCAVGVHSHVPGEYAGAIAEAGNGTLLLEDIDLLRPEVLAALMQALGEGAYRREGESARLPLRARIAATSTARPERMPLRDVPRHHIAVAPLCERPEDILPLAAHFLAGVAEEAGFQPVGFTEEARAALLSESWPGNVRELRERIRQAARLAAGGAITAEALLLAHDGAEIPSFKEAKRAFETRYVTGLLRRCAGNISRAARLAKKDRKDFYDVIRRTGVDPSRFRQ